MDELLSKYTNCPALAELFGGIGSLVSATFASMLTTTESGDGVGYPVCAFADQTHPATPRSKTLKNRDPQAASKKNLPRIYLPSDFAELCVLLTQELGLSLCHSSVRFNAQRNSNSPVF